MMTVDIYKKERKKERTEEEEEQNCRKSSKEKEEANKKICKKKQKTIGKDVMITHVSLFRMAANMTPIVQITKSIDVQQTESSTQYQMRKKERKK